MKKTFILNLLFVFVLITTTFGQKNQATIFFSNQAELKQKKEKVQQSKDAFLAEKFPHIVKFSAAFTNKPTEGTSYIWDGIDWDKEYDFEMVYNSEGLLSRVVVYDTPPIQIDMKYDAQNRLISERYSLKVGNSLIPASRDTMVYHTSGALAFSGFYTYDLVSNTWELMDAYRTTFTEDGGKLMERESAYYSSDIQDYIVDSRATFFYDINNVLESFIEEYNWGGGADSTKIELMYNAGVISEAIEYAWDSTAFVPSSRYSDFIFANLSRPLID